MGKKTISTKAPAIAQNELSVYKAGVPQWTSDGTACVDIRYAEAGIASAEESPAVTLVELFKMACKKNGDKPALRVERPLPPLDGRKAPPALPIADWTCWTYQDYHDETEAAAKGMIALGHERFDAVNIFGFNAPEWFMGEMAGIFAGGRSAGIYPTDSPDQVAFKSAHSGASIIVLESEGNFAKVAAGIEQMPKLKAVVCWACEGHALKRKDGSEVRVITWADLVALGKKQDGVELAKRIELMTPSHCACLIYTSGTTGNPKAVMISHDNIIFESRMVLDIVPNFDKQEEERIISYLPLSHVAGMMVDIVCPIVGAAFSEGYACNYFARPYDLKVGTIGDRLKAVKPTMFLGVPRVWEKIAEKMKAVGANTKGLKLKIATWAKAKGLAHAHATALGGSGSKPFGYGVAEKLVLDKVKIALGLEECRFGFTGAAPITTDTLEYFGALGIQVNEVYGMSECCGATTFSTDSTHVWGSCGFPMVGTEVRVFKCDPSDMNMKQECPRASDMFQPAEEAQGEICFRGRHIMMGYLANPDLGEEHVEEINKKNAGAIDAAGWLHSGDKGCMSATGMVRITGRYKELIIGAGGENIAPVPVEDTIKKHCPAISNIMMVGDKRKYNVAIITLKCVGATGEEPGTDVLFGDAAKVDPACKTVADACKSKAFIQAILDAIKKANADGACCPSNSAKVQKFTILPLDVSQITEELGPTLKLKRGVVAKKYSKEIEAMYSSDGKNPFVDTLSVSLGEVKVAA